MPQGKPAGVRCVQLLDDLSCGIFKDPRRPKVCAGLQAMREMCGSGEGVVGREFALSYLHELERMTAPAVV
ncbi:MAG: zinc/iron-chelating protein [Nevskia sp.]|nr:zinc/iron-chelating protein [Nevskia sp.]